MLIGLCVLLIVIVVLTVLLLPHSAKKSTGVSSGTNPQANQTRGVTTFVTTTVRASNGISQATTTVTTINPANEPLNISSYINGITNPHNTTTSTIVYAYCVGSSTLFFNQSFYAPLYPNGVGQWKPTTNYTLPMIDGTCSVYNGYIYCLGNFFLNFSRNAYYANVTSQGIGAWIPTTSYPAEMLSGSCATYNGYIYCVGTQVGEYSSDTYYAPISQSGIGQWRATTSYPTPFYGADCNIYNGYIYCAGDQYLNVSALVGNSITSIGGDPYYAQVSAAGIGTWKATTPPPIPIIGATCAISNSTIYCLGGNPKIYSILQLIPRTTNSSANITREVNSIVTSNSTSLNGSETFYAHISSSGIGAWKNTTPYPYELYENGCVAAEGLLYCVGSQSSGFQNEVYYSQTGANGIVQWQRTFPYPLDFYQDSCSVGP